MKCQEARQLLSPYIDLVLTAQEKNRLEKHLANCAECRGELAELRSLVDSFKKLGELQAPAGFMDELRLKLRDEKVVMFPKKHPVVTSINPRGWVVTAVAGVALAMGIYISSLVPYQMVANIFDKIPQVIFQKPDQGLPQDIEELIQDKQNQMHVAKAPQKGTSSDVEKGTPGIIADKGQNQVIKPADKSGTKIVPSNPTAVDSGTVKVAARKIDTVNVHMKVADVSSAVGDLKQLAAANSGQLELSSPSLMTGNSRIVTIRVEEDKVDEMVAAIKTMDLEADPSKGKLDITQDYAKLQNRLQEVQDEMKTLNSKASLTNADKDKIKVLEFEKSYLEDKLTSMDENTKLVAINIIIDERSE